jgi:glycerol-3-phosphate O-acyltransferase
MKWLARFFARAEIPAGVEDQLRDLAARGSLVFVMRSAGWLNLSFIRWLVRRLHLPALAATIGLGRSWRALLTRQGTARALQEAVTARAPALIFLRRPSVFRAKGVGAPMIGEGDPFPQLVELQRRLSGPIFLVPILYVWSRRPSRIKPSLLDMVLGSTEAPGILATSIAFFVNYHRAFVRMGRPVDLHDFLAVESRRPAPAPAPGEAPAGRPLVARKVRGALYYHLSREARAVLGPPFKEPARVREEVLRDRALQETIAGLARETGRSAADLARDAARIVREMAARLSPTFIELIRLVVIWICNRLYEGVELDEAGMSEVREAANSGGLVLCPSHKSHMDYVMLSYLFYERGLMPPHVAAGINLAFWPFGAILRWSGGFFIRRSFKGDRLYGAVLRAYIKRLMRDGFSQEFFIEGGRSRTGKLLFPKTGLLAMEVDAWRESTVEDLFFVPIAIDYEKLPEGKSYTKELGGGEKRKESFGALLRARKVLRTRQGRIYVQLGSPISLRALAGEPGRLDDEPARRTFVQSLANRIAHGINRASTITPVGLCAAALLASRSELSAERLGRRIALLRRIAARDGGRLSARLGGDAGGGGPEDGPLAEALTLLRRDGLLHARGAGRELAYTVPPQRRAELDFFRNNLIHHFIAYAIVAAAIGAQRRADADGSDGRSGSAGHGATATATRTAAERDARWLSRLFKLEFIYRVGVPFAAIFAQTFDALEPLGLMAPGPDEDEDGLAFLAQLLRPFLDAYRSAAATLADWPGGDQRAFVRSALERARLDSAADRALPEAINKTTLENAAAWLLAEGALEPAGVALAGGDPANERLQVAARWRTDAASALIAEIDRFRE